MSDPTKHEELKHLITNPKSKIIYKRGSFLGKGGFARCYEFKNTTTGEIFAGKVVSKTELIKPHHKEKVFQEIQIHGSLSHKYVVSLDSYFEDEGNMYIIMELCRKRSLFEMHRRRKSLTIPEVRYFMRQLVTACKYLHDSKVIHRDLKLGNLFINDNMEIKVGDFGLATRVTHEGERKKTLCGTPNYIAPEILTKKGHSYEVDLWSLGCIMYTLLVGTPPFETSVLKNIYSKIKKCDYYLPSRLDHSARRLIQKLLHLNPDMRPNVDTILKDDFLVSGYIPSRLPFSCLTMQPKFTLNMSLCEVSKISSQRPLQERVGNVPSTMPEKAVMEAEAKFKIDVVKAENEFESQTLMPDDFYLNDLLKMLNSVIQCKPEVLFTGNPEDSQDPSAVPFVWISKWVDYTEKYGIGYQLCDNSIGVFFNDATHLVLLQDGTSVQYTERNKEDQYFTTDKLPTDLSKKMTLLNHFNTYMNDHLVKAGEAAKPCEGDEMAHVPHLRAWFRTRSAIIFHLTNGTFQANFFKDHSKIILCPLMGAVSLIDAKKNFTVYTFPLIEKFGCSEMLALRLRYAKSMVEKLCNESLPNGGGAENISPIMCKK